MAKKKTATKKVSNRPAKKKAAKKTTGTRQQATNTSTQTYSSGKGKRQVASHQTPETRVIRRSQLIPAEYNPRTIDKYAFEKLKDSIRQTGGLIDLPIWNERTGHIVGGHQRVSAWDEVRHELKLGPKFDPDNPKTDYDIEVVVVDYPPAKEIEVNIALNNTNSQGQYDGELLSLLLEQEEIHLENTGFDLTTLEMLLDESGLDLPERFLVPPSEEEEDLLEDIEETLEELDAAEQEEEEQNRIEDIRQRKNDWKSTAEFKGQTNFHLVLIFPTDEIKQAFLQSINESTAGNSIDGIAFAKNHLSVDLTEMVESSQKGK